MDQTPQPENQQPDFITKQVGAPVLQKPVAAAVPAAVKPAGAALNFFRENKWYFLAIALGVIIISFLAYFAFRKTPVVPAKEANVNISVDVPQTVPAGGEAIYKIKIDNQDSQKLVNMSLELTYGSGFSFVSSVPNPDNLSGTIFKVPDLIPGQNAVVVVKAKISGNVNDSKDLSIKLHYHYDNFTSEFIKQQTSTVRLVASDITLELQAPTNANNAELLVYTLKYQNNSANSISNARIQLAYPDGFSFATAQPAPDSGNNIWNLGSLAAGASGTITIQGSFTSANPGESKTATASFLVLGADGQYQSQAISDPAITTIASLPLLVSQEVDNLDTGNVVKPGQTLVFNIKYQNNSNIPVNGVNILVTLNSKALDFSSLKAEGAQVNNNTLLWNASSVSGLQTLNPSNSGQLSFSVQVKNPATKDSSKNLTIVSDIKIKANEYETYFPGNEENLKVSSPVQLSATLAYQSGNQPPQVGKATLYAVNFALTNSTNDFSNGVLTAYIPLGPGGYVDGSMNAQEFPNVQYDSSTGKLIWQVGQLSAHTGQFSTSRALNFGVRIIPSASQAGDNPTLVKDIQFTAKDNFTGQTVSASAQDLTTDSTGTGGDGTVLP